MTDQPPKRRRGRPAIDGPIMTVRLPQQWLEEIDAKAGKGKRGEFIRQAVREKLNRKPAEPPAEEPKAPTTGPAPTSAAKPPSDPAEPQPEPCREAASYKVQLGPVRPRFGAMLIDKTRRR